MLFLPVPDLAKLVNFLAEILSKGNEKSGTAKNAEEGEKTQNFSVDSWTLTWDEAIRKTKTRRFKFGGGNAGDHFIERNDNN